MTRRSDKHDKMAEFTLDELDAVVRQEFPEDYDLAIDTEGLVFALQSDYFHETAAGIKLRVGSIVDDNGNRAFIWALAIYKDGLVVFHKDN